MRKEYNKWYLIVIIFSFVFMFFGGTIAYFRWITSTEQRTNIILSVEPTFMCEADGGGDLTSEEKYLVPTDCMNQKYAIQREIKVSPTIYGDTSITMDLWLDVKSIGSGLANSDNFKYALTTDPNSCTNGVVKSGSFKGRKVNDKVELFSYMGYNQTTTDTYYLYVWLDKEETNSNTMNQSFSLSLNGMCTDAPVTKTYVVFKEEDQTLRLYRKDDNVSQVSNNDNENNSVSILNNNIDSYNINKIEDLNITDEDKLFFDLEHTIYSSEEQLPWYEYRDQITKIVVEDEISPISTAYWFKDLNNVTYVDLSKLNTSKVIDMSYMFAGMSSLAGLNISNFNTSNVMSMYHMFDGMSSLNSLDLSNFDTSRVTNMSTMFRGCSKIKTLDLSNFDTSNVTIMHVMFKGMSSLSNLDIGNFNTLKVKSMYEMFCECRSLTELNLSNFNTSQVEQMHGMFSWMDLLTSLNISSFDTSNVNNMEYMFNTTPLLTSLDLSHFDTRKVVNMSRMFSNMSSLITLNISSFDTGNVTNMEKMFRGCSKLTNIDFSSANFSKVTSYTDMFKDISNSSSIVVKDNNQKSWINNKFTNLTNVVIKS